MTAPNSGSIVASFTIPDAEVLPDAAAVQIAGRLRDALQPELGRLDVPVSSRATPDDLPAPAAPSAARSVSGVLR